MFHFHWHIFSIAEDFKYMKQSQINFQDIVIESDDFAVKTILTRLETGEDVDNEEFSAFVKKCQDMIWSLRNMLKVVE